MSTASSPVTHPHSPQDTATGVACGLGAGAFWGLVFLAPALVDDFGPLHLSAGRYLAYGLIAAALIAPRWAALRPRLTRAHWGRLHGLSLVGNLLYYVLLSLAVQQGGIAMTSLVIGFLPVAVTLIGSRDHGAVPLRRLLPSLLCCALGAVLIGGQALQPSAPADLARSLTGLFAAVGALAAWTVFAVGNARSLKQLQGVSPQDWNLLTGVATGLQSLALLPLAWWLEPAAHSASAWGGFVGVCVAVALLASIVGNALWNRMSRLLPLTLVGQMILFETLFALLYGWVWEQRLPSALEAGALACVVLAVGSCVAAHRRPAHSPASPAATIAA